MKPAPSKFIERYLADLSAGSRVLDLACGSGRHTKLALDMGLSVTAIDIDVSRLEDLRDHRDLTVLEADLESGPWPLRDNGFDAVIVANYLWRPLFPKIADTVSTGGLLLYETFMTGNERFGKPSNPDFLLQEDELAEVFGEAFDVLEFWQGEETDPPAIRQRFAGRKQ